MHRKLIIALTILFTFMLVPTAWGANTRADGTSAISRASYCVLLAKTAGITVTAPTQAPARDVAVNAWYAPAMSTLKARGILFGDTAGMLRPTEPVTMGEAALMAGRTLGLSDSMGINDWLVHLGLLPEGFDQAQTMTEAQVNDFLTRVFSSDSQAAALVQKGTQAMAGVKDLTMNTDLTMKISTRPGVADQTIPGSFDMSGQITSQMVMPMTLHQTTRIKMSLPTGAAQTEPKANEVETSMEQYLVDGKLYMKITDPTSKTDKWYKYPGDFTALQALQAKQLQDGAIPEEIKPYLHYRLLGSQEINGKKVNEIAYYGRIDDINAFLKAVAPSLQSMLPAQSQEALGMIKAITYSGTEYLGIDDNLCYSQSYQFQVSFTDQLSGKPFPLASLEMQFKSNNIAYNQGLKIVLPTEALVAPELPQPGGEETTNSSLATVQ